MAKLLLIDDDPDIVESLTMVLTAHGHHVQALSDTHDLLARVQAAEPELILLDVMFPEDAQGGFVAARALASSALLKRIPVLILSAVNQRSRLAFAFSEADISDDFLPVQGFLEKPVEPAALLKKVNELLAAT